MLKFNFDQVAIDDFTGGSCEQFAHSLQTKIGGEIYGIKRYYFKKREKIEVGGYDHFMVCYRGYFIDIEGVWTWEQKLEQMNTPDSELLDDIWYMKEFTNWRKIFKVRIQPVLNYQYPHWEGLDLNPIKSNPECADHIWIMKYANKYADKVVNKFMDILNAL
jgi:hypothetical protein